MIVPRARLLRWFALIVLPFAVVGAVFPALGVASFGLIAALGLAAVADALAGRNRLRDIRVELPEVVRMSKDRAAKIDMRIRNPRKEAALLRLAPSLPREIESNEQEIWVNIPADAEVSRLTWPCKALRRGNFPVSVCHLETASPMGFWGVRREVASPSVLRVYPNLLTERKSLAALFLNRGNAGVHAQRQVGQGRDFEKLREYIPGDGFDEIHWKATAKRGRPITKIFQIEKTQEVYVIIDSSRLTARTQNVEGRETTVLERYVTAALVLGLAAEQQGDLFGLMTFSNKVGKFLRARNGTAHYNACRDAIHAMHPEIVTPDFEELFAAIRLRLRRRALLVFLTALDDQQIASAFVRNVGLISRQHLVLVNMIQPAGVLPLFTGAPAVTHDDLYKRLGGHLLWQNLRELEKVLKRRGAHFSMLANEKLSAQLVSQYIDVKQRQLL